MPTQTDEARDCEFIINLIFKRCRIRLHDGKRQWIRARLGKRLRHHGLETLGQYCDYLRRASDKEEITQMVDALTSNSTRFLRERERIEIVLCRNVTICFDCQTQTQLVQWFAQFLVPNGCLLMGKLKNIKGLNICLRCFKPGIYQKA